MQQVHVTARFSIPGENLAEFKRISRTMVNQVEMNEPETLLYLWFYNEAQTECVVREIYLNSSAVLVHLTNCEQSLARLLEISTMELEIFGRISKELADGAAQIKAKRYTYYAGVDRVSSGN